jgi:hypothetical protein
MDSTLSKIYYDAEQGYCSAQQLYLQAIKKNPAITFKGVQKWLSGQSAYTVHKPARRNYSRNRVLVSGIDEQWQLDLADLSSLQKYNDGYKFILTCIDIFSKYAWAVPLKNKSATTVCDAFESVLKSSNRKPFRVQTDKGTEFLNKDFQKLLKKNDIHFFTTNTETKCCVVERFNRTLKEKMFKYFTAKNTFKYIDVLPQFLLAYNNSPHRTIGMPPSEVSYENEHDILQKVFRLKPLETIKFKCNIGDTVRISKLKKHFEKGYMPNWSEEIFTVHERFSRNPPVYTLKDFSGEKIEGVFYEKEIQKIDNNQTYYVVESVLKTRKRNGKTEHFVKWRGYPDSFNSWVSDLKKL